MSFAYQKAKMQLTSKTVRVARRAVDGTNLLIQGVIAPFSRISATIKREAPWVSGLLVIGALSTIPLVIYPYLKPYFKDTRQLQEEERVRLCLQKGIDPYPYMRHKDHVQGANVPILMVGEGPRGAVPEYTAIDRFIQRKEALLKQTGADVDTTVQELLATEARADRGDE
ncbi:hypothetical protein AGDE_02075 [Angomonas deanei]|nr:hypothetical protein AGDE_02075 [Angomonas deanei]|eukprot:EPY41848.1 hypothetical protein AGDE_02075 [Angomonas deanei]